MATWLTGAFVNVRIALSARLGPRNSQTSPVTASPTASSTGMVASLGTAVLYVGASVEDPGRWPRLAGVVAAGVAAERRRRTYRSYDTDELRSKLHARLASAGTADA